MNLVIRKSDEELAQDVKDRVVDLNEAIAKATNANLSVEIKCVQRLETIGSTVVTPLYRAEISKSL